ncbi:uncharacterized protein LAJ45_10878 [Morchella importuna]|uniref:Uncharacterized protein n=1 Tax=Morchella conica CCBAS932 TaxID=1392247 RepID=A0A3N4LAQ2_9PEZI|nr:uncharacterized protein LAJ45_10878 [Morchella importuna]KAH8145098.1 hypothetical protein LAJ45_10878 [Morchella importuna]RPB17721.1 hypothetical protein P167DRAFT_601524 [Morchella conica CCBAS932]
MPLTTRRAHATRSTTVARKPSLMYRLTHPAGTRTVGTRSTAGTRATRRRTKATGPAPVSTHRRARTKPTLGARIHGMAKKVAGTLTGSRTKKAQGNAMVNGRTPGSRRRRHL